LEKRTTIPEIVLATRNEHKIVEIKAMIGDFIQIQTMTDLVKIDIPEVGRTLMENSFAKAAFVYRLCGKPTLADDSGLFVSSLNGEPGVFSSRYGKDDEERIARLLENLVSVKDRGAAFRVVFVYYYAPSKYETFEGECVGRIARAPHGSEGFGYDPIFIPKGYRQTFAQLGPAIKNRISHRAIGLKEFRRYLTRKTS
jgi:XTP/dITP diphosphohydrolase